MIILSGSKNKPSCSAGDSIPRFPANVGIESGKEVHVGNIRKLYCLFRFFSSPGLASEPGGQSHSGLEAEGRLKGGLGAEPPTK